MQGSSGYRLVDGAWIHETARLAEGVIVEPGALIGRDVEIGEETWIGAGAVVYGPTRVGRQNQIHPTAVLGGAPQEIGFSGEPTRLEIGDRNVFREAFTAHRGSTKGEGVTRIGNDNFLMGGSHVGHDVIVEDHVIAANGVLIAGHSHVQSYVNLSGGVALSQWVTVGRHAFMGGLCGARTDQEPFLCHDVKSGNGPEASPVCVNEVGLKRAGKSPDVIKRLRTAYKVLFLREQHKNLEAARRQLDERDALCPEVEELLTFLGRKRGGRYGRQLQGGY